MSESTQDRPDEADEADEKAQKPGESDTETEAGFPKEGGESGAVEAERVVGWLPGRRESGLTRGSGAPKECVAPVCGRQ